MAAGRNASGVRAFWRKARYLAGAYRVAEAARLSPRGVGRLVGSGRGKRRPAGDHPSNHVVTAQKNNASASAASGASGRTEARTVADCAGVADSSSAAPFSKSNAKRIRPPVA